MLIEVADITRRHQALDDLLVPATGVALERESVSDEDPPDLPLAHLVAVVVEEFDLHTPDDRTNRRRIDLQVLRSGDRGERDLGRAVHVVDDGTDVLERAGGQRGPKLGSADEDDAQCR